MIQVLLEVELEIDGVPVERFPYVRRMDVGALHPFTRIAKAGVPLSMFETVGNLEIDPVELVVITADGPLTYRLDAQIDGGIAMADPGDDAVNVLILCGVNLDAGAVADIGAPGDGNSVLLSGFIGGEPATEGECLGYGEGGYGEGGYGCGANDE